MNPPACSWSGSGQSARHLAEAQGRGKAEENRVTPFYKLANRALTPIVLVDVSPTRTGSRWTATLHKPGVFNSGCSAPIHFEPIRN